MEAFAGPFPLVINLVCFRSILPLFGNILQSHLARPDYIVQFPVQPRQARVRIVLDSLTKVVQFVREIPLSIVKGFAQPGDIKIVPSRYSLLKIRFILRYKLGIERFNLSDAIPKRVAQLGRPAILSALAAEGCQDKRCQSKTE